MSPFPRACWGYRQVHVGQLPFHGWWVFQSSSPSGSLGWCENGIVLVRFRALWRAGLRCWERLLLGKCFGPVGKRWGLQQAGWPSVEAVKVGEFVSLPKQRTKWHSRCWAQWYLAVAFPDIQESIQFFIFIFFKVLATSMVPPFPVTCSLQPKDTNSLFQEPFYRHTNPGGNFCM